jgi:hypothetical protein
MEAESGVLTFEEDDRSDNPCPEANSCFNNSIGKTNVPLSIISNRVINGSKESGTKGTQIWRKGALLKLLEFARKNRVTHLFRLATDLFIENVLTFCLWLGGGSHRCCRGAD